MQFVMIENMITFASVRGEILVKYTHTSYLIFTRYEQICMNLLKETYGCASVLKPLRHNLNS